ncbi:MAG: hypothetical protein ACJ8G1_13900, partial [Vitreoscilla sp.]
MRNRLHDGCKPMAAGGAWPLRTVAVAVALAGGAGSAAAFPIDTGHEDFEMCLDSTASFTAAARVRGRDDSIAANPALSASVASDSFADKGD